MSTKRISNQNIVLEAVRSPELINAWTFPMLQVVSNRIAPEMMKAKMGNKSWYCVYENVTFCVAMDIYGFVKVSTWACMECFRSIKYMEKMLKLSNNGLLTHFYTTGFNNITSNNKFFIHLIFSSVRFKWLMRLS